MAIKPILFNKQISTEIVRAILDGRKTRTRRILKHDVESILNSPYHKKHPEVEERQIISKLCQPPYQPGDIMYVRETWQYLYELDGNEQIIEETGKYYYAATDTIPFDTYVDASGVTHERVPWHPSIHMPKEAARIWLKVTDVRVERLQEITEECAKKEGAIDNRGFIHSPDNEYDSVHTAREHFAEIWDSTIKKSDLDRYGWNANPWVWVIEFERCEKPEGV